MLETDIFPRSQVIHDINNLVNTIKKNNDDIKQGECILVIFGIETMQIETTNMKVIQFRTKQFIGMNLTIEQKLSLFHSIEKLRNTLVQDISNNVNSNVSGVFHG